MQTEGVYYSVCIDGTLPESDLEKAYDNKTESPGREFNHFYTSFNQSECVLL